MTCYLSPLISSPFPTLAVHEPFADAIQIHRALASYNEEHPAAPIRVRIGIGVGEPVTDGKALFGSIINLTARVCAHAGAEQILTTGEVRDLSEGEGFHYVEHGAETFKGFDDPVPIHEVLWAPQ